MGTFVLFPSIPQESLCRPLAYEVSRSSLLFHPPHPSFVVGRTPSSGEVCCLVRGSQARGRWSSFFGGGAFRSLESAIACSVRFRAQLMGALMAEPLFS